MENENVKSQEEAGPYTGDESNQQPVNSRDLGSYADKIVVKDENGEHIVDVKGVVKAPLTEVIRKPFEEVTTRVSTDENTVVEENVKTTVSTEDTNPKEEGIPKDKPVKRSKK